MKKSIISGVLALTIFLGVGQVMAVPVAQAQSISIQQLIQLLIAIGIIPANKVAVVESIFGITNTASTTPASITNTGVTTPQTTVGTTYKINSINPSSATAGSMVTISGANFNQYSLVGFDNPNGGPESGADITPTNITPNSITFIVPATNRSPTNPSTLGINYVQVYANQGQGGVGDSNTTNINVVAAPTYSAPLSVSCTATPSDVGTPSIVWTSNVSGGANGAFTFSWSVYGDVSSYVTGSTVSPSFGDTYSSVGKKNALLTVTDPYGNNAVASCSGTIIAPQNTSDSITSSSTISWKTYTNTQYGYQISYPAGTQVYGNTDNEGGSKFYPQPQYLSNGNQAGTDYVLISVNPSSPGSNCDEDFSGESHTLATINGATFEVGVTNAFSGMNSPETATEYCAMTSAGVKYMVNKVIVNNAVPATLDEMVNSFKLIK